MKLGRVLPKNSALVNLILKESPTRKIMSILKIEIDGD